jgi:hypothetical protein
MKTYSILIIILFLIVPGYSYSEDFLGVPVFPGGKIVKKTEDRLQLQTESSHDEVVSFYKDALKELTDIKFRAWKDSTYIEDDGNRPWHSVTISKGGNSGTTIVIMKDSWTWIIGTLVLRYIGVFVVLLVLLIGMSISGAIISRSVGKEKK